MLNHRKTPFLLLLLATSMLACQITIEPGGETPSPEKALYPTLPPARSTPTDTPTPTHTPTPPPPPTPTVPNWPVVLADDFDDPESGFTRSSDDESRLFYEDGQYVIGVIPEDWAAWSSRSGNVSDFVVEVAVTAEVQVGLAGVIFRKEGGSQFYIFAIRPDGHYSLMKHAEAVEAILDWRDSSHIRTGADTNRLRLVCVGPTITLYVNGQYLDTVQDTTFTEGEIGMIAGTWEGETHALFHFDNLRVYAPAPMVPPTATPTLTPTVTPTRAPATPTVPPSPTPVTRGPVEFDPIVFAEGLTAELDPVMPSMSFVYGIKKVYAVWACRGMYRGLEIVHKWYHDGREVASGTVVREVDNERGREWVSMDGPNEGPLPSGHYTLELWVHGQLLRRGSFLIQ
jgi:hypothetical protein